MAFQSFEDLEVWKISCQLAVHVYKSLGDLRDFGLKDQMQRGAVSVASNIAEGYERTDKEFAGSCQSHEALLLNYEHKLTLQTKSPRSTTLAGVT